MKMHIPGSRVSSPAASLLQMLFTVLMGTLNLLLLLIFGIRTQEAGDTFFNPLYANLIICSLFCSAIARPATILQTIDSYDFDPRYCTAYTFVLELETVGIPLAVLALIVERSIYFSCLPLEKPLKTYKQRLSHAWKILLVVVPWFCGALFAFVKTFGLLQPIVPLDDVKWDQNDTQRYYSCHLEGWSHQAHDAGLGLLYSVRSGIPFLYLCVATVVMVIYWCKAYRFVNQCYEYEDDVDNKKCGKWIAASENERVVGLVWRPRRNSYNMANNNTVVHIKEDQNQNHACENNQENGKNASSCTMVDSANESPEDEVTQNILNGVDDLLDDGPTKAVQNSPTQGTRKVFFCNENVTTSLTDERGKVKGVRRRVCSQDEETTETHEPKPTTQEPNTQRENHHISGIRQRTLSQEATETSKPKPTFQDQPLDNETYDPVTEPNDKTNATVGIVILLALICACVAVGGSVMVKYYSWLYETTQWLYFGLEFTAVLLAYCWIPEVRRTLFCRRHTYRDQDRNNQRKTWEEMSNLSNSRSSGYSSGVSDRGGESPSTI